MTFFDVSFLEKNVKADVFKLKKHTYENVLKDNAVADAKVCLSRFQEKKKYEALCDELKAQKESEIEELQSNLSRLQAVSPHCLGRCVSGFKLQRF